MTVSGLRIFPYTRSKEAAKECLEVNCPFSERRIPPFFSPNKTFHKPRFIYPTPLLLHDTRNPLLGESLEEMISLVPVTFVYGLMNSVIIKMVMEIVEWTA